ncbi:MAG: hypothetical protein JNM36_08980 [Chitinophagales bacterium]|nr:hypothetical protein [Chitinophagales bacterium]
MINLKNLKNLFVIDEEEEKKPNTEEKPPQTKQETPPQEEIRIQQITILDPNATDNTTTPPPIINTTQQNTSPPPLSNTHQNIPPQNNNNMNPESGSLDRRVFEKLMDVIQTNNVEGFDYLEFKNSVKALANLNLDEATMYKSAYATASTMGLTVDKLLQSINYYKSLLNKELQTFNEQAQRQIDERVVAKDKERVMLENTIAEKQNQIARLQAEIQQHQQQLNEIQHQSSEVRSKITEMQNNFKVTHAHLIAQFDTDLQKIQQYLK